MPEGVMTSPEVPPIPVQETGPSGVEKALERPAPIPESALAHEPTVVPAEPMVPITPVAPALPATKELEQKVDSILSAGLEETYKKLDPATQQKFRVEGEKTAHAITLLLQSSKIQIKKIVELIIAWLRIIPGVNRFFLEQEAKIKADKLLHLRP